MSYTPDTPAAIISTGNSSNTPLGSNGIFTGTSESVYIHAEARLYVFSDQASAVDGLSIQQSSNGTNWDITDTYTITANTGKTFGVGISGSYFRVVYTNGPVAHGSGSSFRIQVVYHSSRTKPSSVRPQDARSNENDFEEVSSFLNVYNGTTWDRLRGTIANGALVDVSRLPSLPAGGNIIGSLVANQSVNVAQINGVAPSMGSGANGTGVQRMTIATDQAPIAFKIDQTTPGATNKVDIGNTGTVTSTPIAITKATQGATGYTTQDLKDAGRSSKSLTLDVFAVAAVAETLNTVSYSTDNGTATTGTSYTVTAGKRFRLQSITANVSTITGNTTAVNVILRIRINNAGAAVVTSPTQFVIPIQGIAAANQAGGLVEISIPDGYEIVAGAGIGVTTTCAGFVATTAAPKVSLTITGYEY